MKRVFLAGVFALALISAAFAQSLPSPHVADLNLNGTSLIDALPGLSTSVPAPSTFSLPNSYGLDLGTNPSGPWIIADKVTSADSDQYGGALYVAKTTDYGTAADAGGNAPAIYGFNIVSDGVWGNQAGVMGVIHNSNTQHSQPGSTASAVALYGTGICGVSACTATWGGVIAAYDTSGQTDPTHPLIGLEVDNYANGTDSSLNRVGLQISAGRPTGNGTVNTVGHGIYFTGDGTDGQYTNLIDGGTSHAVNGVTLANMTFSGIAFNSPGFQIDNAGNEIVKTTKLNLFTEATLPTCNSSTTGMLAIVTDLASAPTYNTAIGTGGGSNVTLALCRNSAWTSH